MTALRQFPAIPSGAVASDAMQLAIACLGGRKLWSGSALGLFGLINRGFSISSDGVFEDGALVFRETLRFDDGEVQDRMWRVAETSLGLVLEADGIETIKPGRIENGALVFDYRIVMGGVAFSYRDEFRIKNGGVDNVGAARLFGLTILTITARGVSA
ncbi:MAG: DUF3833 family protein [Parvularculaceae bacterium]